MATYKSFCAACREKQNEKQKNIFYNSFVYRYIVVGAYQYFNVKSTTVKLEMVAQDLICEFHG